MCSNVCSKKCSSNGCLIFPWHSPKKEIAEEAVTFVLGINVCNYIESSTSANITIQFPENPSDADVMYIKDLSTPMNTSNVFHIACAQHIEAFPGAIREGPYLGLCGITKSGVREWKFLGDKNTWYITSWL